MRLVQVAFELRPEQGLRSDELAHLRIVRPIADFVVDDLLEVFEGEAVFDASVDVAASGLGGGFVFLARLRVEVINNVMS